MSIEADLTKKQYHLDNKHHNEIEVSRLQSLLSTTYIQEHLDILNKGIRQGRFTIKKQRGILKGYTNTALAKKHNVCTTTIMQRRKRMEDKLWVDGKTHAYL